MSRLDAEIFRPDIDYIVKKIDTGMRVLDLGCGDGNLMQHLEKKNIRVQGLEKDENCIYKCIEKGLLVHHGDLDEGLVHHLDKSFDYVILNQTIQETRYPGGILLESLRIGKKVIVVFPNFGYYKIRIQILLNGATPVTDSLPYRWYNTPNLHFLSVTDFQDFCKDKNIETVETAFFRGKNKIKCKPNFAAELALFIIKEKS